VISVKGIKKKENLDDSPQLIAISQAVDGRASSFIVPK